MDNQQENQISDTNPIPATSKSVGQILRAAREEMGLSINDVANRIKFAPRQVEYLEDDDYKKLPEAAFVRGFIRSYARLLELDPANLISALPSSHVKTALAQEVKSVEIPMPSELSARRYNIMLLAAGLVIVSSVAIYESVHDRAPEVSTPVVKTNMQAIDLPNVKAGDLPDQASEEAKTAAPESQAASRTATVASPSSPTSQTAPRVVPDAVPQQPPHQAATRIAPVFTTQQSAPQASARVVPLPVPQPAPAQVAVRTTPAPLAASKPVTAPTAVTQADKPVAGAETGAVEHALRMEFDQDSWVEVKDASDKPLISRMHRAGSLVRVTGKAPLMVTIGNSSAVRLFDNGKKINLERYTTADVAHITLK